MEGCLSRIKAEQQAWEVLTRSNSSSEIFRIDELAKYESFICGMCYQIKKMHVSAYALIALLCFHSYNVLSFSIGWDEYSIKAQQPCPLTKALMQLQS